MPPVPKSLSTSPKKERIDDKEYVVTRQNTLSDLDIESELLLSMPEAPPFGNHKHLHMIQLQALLHGRTGVWITIEELWKYVERFYDIDEIDVIHSQTPELPSTPKLLSPLLPPSDRKTLLETAYKNLSSKPSSSRLSSTSLSPAPSVSDETDPAESGTKEEEEPTKSAVVINHPHFARCFALPGFEDGEEGKSREERDGEEDAEWVEMIHERAGAVEGDSVGEAGWVGEGDKRGLKKGEEGEDEDVPAEDDEEEEGEGEEDQDEDEEEIPVKRGKGRPSLSASKPTSKAAKANLKSPTKGKKPRESNTSRRNSGSTIAPTPASASRPSLTPQPTGPAPKKRGRPPRKTKEPSVSADEAEPEAESGSVVEEDEEGEDDADEDEEEEGDDDEADEEEDEAEEEEEVPKSKKGRKSDVSKNSNSGGKPPPSKNKGGRPPKNKGGRPKGSGSGTGSKRKRDSGAAEEAESETEGRPERTRRKK